MSETEKKIEEILNGISKYLETEITLIEDPNNNNRVTPHYDMNGAVSKLIALFVYCGMNVPNSFAPPYNRVHADVEFWKKYFSNIEDEAAKKAAEVPAA